ncbi:unnamed protein product [Sphagnum jensenii]
MSSNDESSTTHVEPRYQLRSNTQPFEPISLSSRSSRRYHQASTAPSSSSTTPIRNSGSSYTTSTVHQSPFGGVNQWGTPIAAPAFTPSSYIPLQAMTSTPTYTMEEQHSPRILGVTQIPNPAYATAIAIASQAALQAAITHHGTVPNNPDPVPTSVVLSPQQLIVATANIPPTINAPTFADPVGEFFRILELEFPVKSSEKNLQLATFSRQKDETLKMLYRRLLKLKEDT